MLHLAVCVKNGAVPTRTIPFMAQQVGLQAVVTPGHPGEGDLVQMTAESADKFMALVKALEHWQFDVEGVVQHG